MTRLLRRALTDQLHQGGELALVNSPNFLRGTRFQLRADNNWLSDTTGPI
jgi:hypothetical protein